MANEEISSVPTINDRLISKASLSLRGLLFDLSTSSLADDEEVSIKRNSHDIWADENELWSPEKHNLKLRGVLEVKDISHFFGPAERNGFMEKAQGIVPRGAEIGFLVQWVSKCRDLKTSAFTKSGCILPTTKRKFGSTGYSYIFEHMFDPGTIKGSLSLAVFAYIAAPAEKVEGDEMMFMNEAGYMFYPPVHESKYLFQPDTVPFPIKEVNEPGKPLWWLWIRDTIEDPAVEMFQESNVSICINRGYPGFDALLLKKNRAALLMVHTEVVATAYYLLVKYLQNHQESRVFWPCMMTGEGLERNTIPEVIGRFLRESEIRTEGISDVLLHQRISEEMKKRLSE